MHLLNLDKEMQKKFEYTKAKLQRQNDLSSRKLKFVKSTESKVNFDSLSSRPNLEIETNTINDYNNVSYQHQLKKLKHKFRKIYGPQADRIENNELFNKMQKIIRTSNNSEKTSEAELKYNQSDSVTQLQMIQFAHKKQSQPNINHNLSDLNEEVPI